MEVTKWLKPSVSVSRYTVTVEGRLRRSAQAPASLLSCRPDHAGSRCPVAGVCHWLSLCTSSDGVRSVSLLPGRCRTCKGVSSKAALLGLSWPLEFRAPAKVVRKPKLSDHQQAEALKRRAAGESCRAIARIFDVHHGTIARLAR